MNTIDDLLKLQSYQILNKISEGASSVEKYLLLKNGEKYLLRLYDARFMNGRYEAFKYASQLYSSGINVPKIYDVGKLDDKAHGYSIIEWVEGVSLDKLLISDTLCEKYGALSGGELLKVHQLNKDNSVDVYQKYIDSVFKKIKKIERLDVKINLDDVYKFILNESTILKDRPTSIIHGDFHPGNIVLKEDKIYFIDLDVCKKDYAWIDLSTNACNMDFPKFYVSSIKKYFDNNIPNDFWIIYNLYGILYCLDYILYCMRIDGKTLEDGIRQMQEFLNYTDNFSSLQPDWFNDKKIRKERLK